MKSCELCVTVCAVQALRPGTDTLLDAAALQAIASEAPSATLPREKVTPRLDCATPDSDPYSEQFPEHQNLLPTTTAHSINCIG
jgi:hypothetical protein